MRSLPPRAESMCAVSKPRGKGATPKLPQPFRDRALKSSNSFFQLFEKFRKPCLLRLRSLSLLLKEVNLRIQLYDFSRLGMTEGGIFPPVNNRRLA